MNEQELVDSLAEAEKLLNEAKRGLAEAKRRWTDAETNVIDAKLNRDRIKEQLRVFRNQQVIPGQHYGLYDEEG